MNGLDDQTLILADIACKAMRQMKTTVAQLTSERMVLEETKRIATIVTSGTYRHDYPITSARRKS